MTTSTTSKLHVATEDDREGGGASQAERRSEKASNGAGRAGGRSPRRPSRGRAALAGVLLVAVAAAPALATPSVDAPAAAAADPAADVSDGARRLNLRLDGRAAGRLLAEAGDAEGAGADDKAKGDEKPGDKGDDGLKMTVTKGAPPAAKSMGSDDTFAFVKDWPFWAIVGGVVIVGASVYMINRNNNQDRSCPGVYNAGCFGAK